MQYMYYLVDALDQFPDRHRDLLRKNGPIRRQDSLQPYNKIKYLFSCVLLLMDNIIMYLFRKVLLLQDNIPFQMCFALAG